MHISYDVQSLDIDFAEMTPFAHTQMSIDVGDNSGALVSN
jgi:hypothetical protein